MKSVLNRIRENPKVSTMGIATVEGVAHTTVFRILWRQQLNPTVYRVYRRLNMLAMNREGYFVYFSILFTELLLKRTYLVSFMFTDEASFTRNRVTNVHNFYQYLGRSGWLLTSWLVLLFSQKFTWQNYLEFFQNS